MKSILDLDRYPIDRLNTADGQALISNGRDSLQQNGVFTLPGFFRRKSVEQILAGAKPVLDKKAFRHSRHHNIYFEENIPELRSDHPALRKGETTNHTICGDQILKNPICRVYNWSPLIDFLANVMAKKRLYVMDDPIAALNIIEYRPGEAALNWHFDRSEFTTTLLLSSADSGGEFQYRSSLRTIDDPNYDGVGALLSDRDSNVRTLPLAPGTLCVFKGVESAHRVTPVTGKISRIVVIFSYYERPGVCFSESELLGFYGRIK